MQIREFILEFQDGSTPVYEVQGYTHEDFDSAWNAALGCWQAVRSLEPNLDTNESDADILASIGNDVMLRVAELAH